MSKEKIKSAIEKAIRYMNGNYYSKLEEKMIVGYLEGALKELEEVQPSFKHREMNINVFNEFEKK